MRVLAVCLLVLFSNVGALLTSVGVMADSDTLWSQGVPTVLKDVSLVVSPGSGCVTYSQDVLIAELHTVKSVCLYGDERLRIGYFYDGNARQAVVQLPFSNKTHVLHGICVVECRYAPDTDVLVTTQQTSQYGRGLVVYRHASERVKVSTLPEGTLSYTFDTTAPDYEMKSDMGKYITTMTFNVSDNGQWVVAELQGKGTAILDVHTLASRQIVGDGYQYGVGMDPVEQLAVSNNGKSVVVTGMNAGFRVIDVTPECGQPLLGDLSLPLSVPCPSSDIGIGVLFPNFRFAERAHFLGDGHQFEVIVNSWVQSARRVTFGTHGSILAHQLRLLSLGDSFSSGEGETDDSYYVVGTNEAFNTCHVSLRAYSGLIAKSLGISDNDAKNIACSGAKIGDIVGPEASYFGQGQRLGATGLRLTPEEARIAQQQAIDNFQPGKALQSSFIERYNPEILTIGIGGNDAGLMGKLRTCAMPGTCEWATGEGIQKTAGEIQRLSGTLGSFFSSIAEEAEHSRIFVVGYPQIINGDGACDAITSFLFDHEEQKFIENSIRYLNQVIRSSADKAGFYYADIEDSLRGEELCSGAAEAMNGLRFGDDIAPISSIPVLKIIGTETFHPTPRGHQLIADKILADYPGLTGQPVARGDVDPEDSSYWDTENPDEVPRAYATDFAFSDESSNPRNMTIHLPDAMVQPGTTVTITIQSEPLQIAVITSDAEGGVDGAITIPGSVEDGFHTIHLLGTNREGKAIDMYQFVTLGDEGHLAVSGSNDESSKTDISKVGPVDTILHEVSRPFETFLNGVTSLAESGEVLGAHIQKGIEQPAHYAGKLLKNNKVWVFVIAGAVTLVILLFLRTRWAKPGT